ncbi:hypothetical protein OpiT1DRAFT_00945 [Opitutaceae bacterium TAV1]|nr:hypothetical protein OpiT1DRAFT_00945 [Opitutaceae bacterium TAV1]
MPRRLLPVFFGLWFATQATFAADSARTVEVRTKPGAPWRTENVRLLADLPLPPAEPVPLDRLGGDARVPLHATGFFRVERAAGGRWWLVTPDGHPWYSVGLAVVKSTSGRSAVVREALREKFGTAANWAETTTHDLRALGFNSLGAWSETAPLRAVARPLPYTLVHNFMGSYGRKRGGTYQLPGHTGYPENAIFVFDPEFERFCDEFAAARLPATRDDPWLLGYFSDNELPFRSRTLDNFLRLPADDPGGRAARDWLRVRRGSADTAPSADDRAAFLDHVADRYYRIVSAAIRRHDPNHLYLGSRLHGQALASEAVWTAAGRYVDVIAANIYGQWTPDREQFARWARWSGRPFLVSEWYVKAEDSGLPNTTGAGWIVRTQADRGRFYQHFALGLLETPSCVGWHWFRYMDNDPADLSTDPSNRDSNKGILDIRFTPWTGLTGAMRPLNERVYDLLGYFDRHGRDS